MDNHFSIIITGYNSKKWAEFSVRSALSQNYEKFHVYCVDAQTDDGTYEILKAVASRYPDRFTLIRNDSRKFQVQNIHEVVRDYVPENSIVVSLDLDDWLKHPDVLLTLNDIYNDDTWMTYGTYEEYPFRDVSGHYHAYPDEVIKSYSYRNYKWLGSHLRTWRRKLFLSIPEHLLKDANGNYYQVAGDQVFMFPLLEMAGAHSIYIPDVLYVYNKTNVLSEDKTSPQEQVSISNTIRSLPHLNRLEFL